MQRYCYLNEKIIPYNKACIKPTDIGLLRGYGVFEFLRTYYGKPFLLSKHLKRLVCSAKYLGLKVPKTQPQIEEIIKELIKKNRVEECAIRIILTGGESKDSKTFQSSTFCILIEDICNYPKRIYEKGIKLATVDYKREIPEAKTLNYIVGIRELKRAKEQKAFEPLYVFDNSVLECATSNFFIFKNNVLITPKKDILLGVTRNLIIKLAGKKFKIEERELLKKELDNASEAFITATSKEIIPVVKIDNKKIGDGRVGKNTKILMEIFQDFIKKFE